MQRTPPGAPSRSTGYIYLAKDVSLPHYLSIVLFTMPRKKRQQRPTLALPATSPHLDSLVGSKTPTLCSPTEPVRSQPIYIISPEVITSSGIVTTRYVKHGPTSTDPIFAFSFLDNLIVNQASHHKDDSIGKPARDSLRELAAVGRGRAYENTQKTRRAVCGLFPRQVYEHVSERIVSVFEIQVLESRNQTKPRVSFIMNFFHKTSYRCDVPIIS